MSRTQNLSGGVIATERFHPGQIDDLVAYMERLSLPSQPAVTS
jgi:hypothetical protein